MIQRDTVNSIISEAIAHTPTYAKLTAWAYLIDVLSESEKFPRSVLDWRESIENRLSELAEIHWQNSDLI